MCSIACFYHTLTVDMLSECVLTTMCCTPVHYLYVPVHAISSACLPVGSAAKASAGEGQVAAAQNTDTSSPVAPSVHKSSSDVLNMLLGKGY